MKIEIDSEMILELCDEYPEFEKMWKILTPQLFGEPKRRDNFLDLRNVRVDNGRNGFQVWTLPNDTTPSARYIMGSHLTMDSTILVSSELDVKAVNMSHVTYLEFTIKPDSMKLWGRE